MVYDDAVARTRQAWVRTGLGAFGVALLALRSALVGGTGGVGLLLLLGAVAFAVGAGVQSIRRLSRSGAPAGRTGTLLLLSAILLLCSAAIVWILVDD